MRIVFAGTPQFAVPPLAALTASSHEVVGVLTQPDRPAGRGRKLTASPIKEFAIEHGIAVAQPKTLRTEDGRQALREWRPDVLVVVAYGLILPLEALTIPPHGCINIHASLLPRWRGAAPIQRAILAGDRVTGVTIMQMDVGLDTGPMLLQRETPIGDDDDAESLQSRLAELGAAALLDVLAALEQGALQPVVQPAAGMTYAAKIDKAEAHIDWAESAVAIDRRIRAFKGWPSAATAYRGEPLRIHRARVASDTLNTAANAQPGRLLGVRDDALLVACGEGILAITQLQRAGKRSVSGAEFANGLRDLQECFFE